MTSLWKEAMSVEHQGSHLRMAGVPFESLIFCFMYYDSAIRSFPDGFYLYNEYSEV